MDLNEADGSMVIDGTKVRFLRSRRDPAEIGWDRYDVRLVVDTTGQFLDPNVGLDIPQGTIRGHLASGADKVIISASMATVHAATGSQEVLDRLPKSGKTDLRKNRSIMNNIILTTTGAARALRLVIPEMEEIAFIAESVRIPTSSGSLIILVINLQEEPAGEYVRREMINDIYRQAAEDSPQGYLYYTEKQNVSGDIIGMPRVAATIEGYETHSRTAEATIDLAKIPGLNADWLANPVGTLVTIPVTQAVIYGWYDNEMGSYVNMLGDRTVSIAELI